jgi:tRNA A-37 threonylcarbamoyl transferase component Bud32
MAAARRATMLTGLAGCRCPQVLHGTRVWYHPDWQEDLGELGLADRDNWRVPVDVPAVSFSKYVIACYRITLASGRVIYYKRYDYRTRWKAALRFWLRPSKAGVEKWGYQRYHACGVDVPRIVAYGESRVMGLLRVAFIITEEVPDTISLDSFVAAGLPGIDAAERVAKMSAFAGRLLESIRKAHGACVFHYDLKWRNILVQSRDGEYFPVIIDCPRAFASCLRRRYGITADLSALARLAVSYLTLSQRYRFLAACIGDAAGPGTRKDWYRRVQRRLEKRPPEIISMQQSPLQGVRFDGKS